VGDSDSLRCARRAGSHALFLVTGLGWDDFRSPRRVWSEHSVKPHERPPRGRHECRQPRKELHRLHHPMGLSAPGLAQGVRDPTVWQAAQALEAQVREILSRRAPARCPSLRRAYRPCVPRLASR
jgi:hypothetical protein